MNTTHINDGPDPAAVGRQKLRSASYASQIAFAILLSRIAGLVRERFFAHYLGNSTAAGAFKAAIRIPNFLQNLFGEGVLSGSFIPVYARLLAEQRPELAGRVAGAIAALTALVTSVLVLLGMLASPLLVDLIAPGFEGEVRDLTVDLVRILFPGVGLLVLSAWCLGVLNSHRKFFIPYVAPVLWNLVLILTLVGFGSRLAGFSLARTLAWGAVVGSALQFGIQLPFVLRNAPAIRLALDWKLEPVRRILGNFAPLVVGRGVVQVSAFVDEIMASFLGAAAVAGLSYAYTIALLPISLFGMSVAAAELPQMSGELGSLQEVHARLRQRLDRGLRQIAFLVVPTATAFILIGDLLVAALYQTGRFGPADTVFVWCLLGAYSVGLLAATQGRLYSSAFYALGDTRTPVLFAVARVALAAALGYLLAFPLRAQLIALTDRIPGLSIPQLSGGAQTLGAVGLTMAAGLAAWVEFRMLRRALNHRLGRTGLPVRYLAGLWILALAGVAVARLTAWISVPALNAWLPGFFGLPHVAVALFCCAAFGLTYFGGSILMGVPESTALVSRVLRR